MSLAELNMELCPEDHELAEVRSKFLTSVCHLKLLEK